MEEYIKGPYADGYFATSRTGPRNSVTGQPRGLAASKIRTRSGPTAPTAPEIHAFPQVTGRCGLYHQQTKNLLVSYSPKKLGFF
ncbi:hypothetical protein [Streptomyces sp. NBC_01190]|uniref:hypothetical protein n=1 Tax=Streptomyces sp. NBC_01190 TaxID=2903767 RepID=UPI0038669E7A|nr:hypothetical protein OG519_02380 [Streptomyces sp. NBC_01190]